MADKSKTPWLKILLAGLLSFVTSFILVAVTMMGYAFTIAFQARGAPDPQKIEAFGNRMIPYVAPASLAVLVFLAAWWVARRAKSTQPWHGLLLGLVAALPTLVFMRRPDLGDLVRLVLPPLSGLAGAFVGRSRAIETEGELIAKSG